MKTVKILMALVMLILLLGMMAACSEEDLSGATSGPTIDVEGDYVGAMRFTQVEAVLFTWEDEEPECYNPTQEGDADMFLNMEIEVNYSASLEGNGMTLYSNNTDGDIEFLVKDLEGTYDTAKNEFVYIYPGEDGFNDGVMTMRFYEDNGIVKAEGEMVQEYIKTGWTNIMVIELSKVVGE